MSWIERVKGRLGPLVRLGQLGRVIRGGGGDDDLSTELRHHLELEAEDLVRHGWEPEAARREAFRRFGGEERTKERVREGRGGRWLSDLLRDARYAVRSLGKDPGFALMVVVLLGAGVGATTTIFGVVDTVVLRPLPYPELDRVVHFDQGSHAYPVFREWTNLEAFEMVAAARPGEVDLTGRGRPARIAGVSVSPDFFRLFGGAPYLGRLFQPGDYPGDRSETVLSYSTWTRLGADPSLVGQALRIDGAPVTVVGVLEPGFSAPLHAGGDPEIWFALDDGGEFADSHGFRALQVAGRLAPGVSLREAQDQVDAQRSALATVEPRYFRDNGSLLTVPLVGIQEATVRGQRSTLLFLLGAVGLLLLIACVNVANLLTARGATRGREIALRGALGASRSRVARQLLTESVVLALAGGLVGVALAYGGVALVGHLMPEDVPRIGGLAVDARVLAFSLALSVSTGLVFGSLPVVQALRTDLNRMLQEGALATTVSRAGRRLRSGLVVSEIALAVVLVTGAGLLSRTLVAMIRVDPGFEVEGLVVLPLSFPPGTDGEGPRAVFGREVLDAVRGVPGVESAALAWTTPFTTTGGTRRGMTEPLVGDPALADPDDPVRRYVHPVTADYFRTLGVRVVAGRGLREGDELVRPVPVVLSARAAAELYGSVDPIDRSLRSSTPEEYIVVGVVESIHHWGLDQDPDAGIYVPYRPEGMFGSFHAVVRTAGPAEGVVDGLRQAVWSIAPDLPIDQVTTMEARVSESVASPRFLATLLGTFAAVALLMACGGVHGSMLHAVGQRRREMGIRQALGATGGDVTRLVLRHGIVLAGLGLVLGTAAALLLSDVMQSLVWGIETTDPITFMASVGILALAAIGAALTPAWQASRTSPVQALRTE